MNKKLRIAITHGDTNGIGYELILKAFAQPELLELCTPIVYGSEKVAAYYRKALELDVHWHCIEQPEDAHPDRLNLIDVIGDEEVKIEPGRPSAEAGRMAFRSLEAATAAAHAGRVDALVTCPINKADIQSADFRYPGHTEFLQAVCGGKALMVLLNPLMRVALVTTHLPLSEVAEKITPERVEAQLRCDATFASPPRALPCSASTPTTATRDCTAAKRWNCSRPSCSVSTARDSPASAPTVPMDSSVPVRFATSMQCWPCTTIRASRPSRRSRWTTA